MSGFENFQVMPPCAHDRCAMFAVKFVVNFVPAKLAINCRFAAEFEILDVAGAGWWRD